MSNIEQIARGSKSESFKKKNPQLFPVIMNIGGEDDEEHDHIAALTSKKPKPAKRLKQSTKPLMNKLEGEFHAELMRYAGLIHIRAQAKIYRLANGVTFCPDFTAKQKATGQEVAFEVKGHMRDDAAVKLKCAAASWPDVRWTLVWKVNGCWHEQVVLP